MDTILFSDIGNNHYLFSYYRRKLLYLDACSFEICHLYLEEHKPLEGIEFFLSHNYSKQERERALKTLDMLKENDFFKPYSPTIIGIFDFHDLDFAALKVITFEVTQRCNLRCKYCINGEMYGNDENNYTKNLSFEKAKSVIDFLFRQFQEGDSVHPQLTFGFYGGEPLLQIDLVKQIVEYVKVKFSSIVELIFTMTTNGILLKEHIDFLVANKFQLLVSLDGDRQNSEYRIPQGQDELFLTIYNNLKYVQNTYPLYFEECVAFNSVLHDKVSLKSMLTFFKKEFNKLPLLSELSTIGIENKEKYRKMYRACDKEVEDIADKISTSDYTAISPRIPFINKFFNNLLIGRSIKSLQSIDLEYAPDQFIISGTCMPFSFKLFVSAAGKLYPCEKIGYKYSLGYIDENNQIVIEPKHVSHVYNSIFSKAKDKCGTCYNIYSCTSCLLERAGECDYQTKEQFVKGLSDYINDLIKRKRYLEHHEADID